MRDHASDRPPDHEGGEFTVEGTLFGVGKSSLSSEILVFKFISK